MVKSTVRQPMTAFIRNILVVLYGSEEEVPTLKFSVALCHQFNAKLKCLHISTNEYSRYTGWGFTANVISKEIEKFDEENRKQGIIAHNLYNKILTSFIESKITLDSIWQHSTGNPDTVVSTEGRISDLILISNTVSDKLFYDSVLTSILFDTGRPVVVVPDTEITQSSSNTVAIAWDGSARASKAIYSALPLLTTGKRVLILTEKNKKQSGPSVRKLMKYLETHEIDSHHIDIKQNFQSTGEALLETALEHESGIMVMGAYSHNRLLEIIFGGVTQYMLENTRIPLWMVH